MIQYFWWGLAVIAIAALVALIVYATRAGRNAQSVTDDAKTTDEAQATAAIVQAVAKAQAEGPQSKDQLLARLDAGSG